MSNHTAEKEDLEQYTVAELKDIAAKEGVEVSWDARKDEIIKAIEKERKAKGKAEGEEDAEVSPLALTGPVLPLPLSDIVADVYGIGKKYTIGFTDMVQLGSVMQGNFLIDNLAPGSILQIVRVKHNQSVAAAGLLTSTAQVGDGTNLWGTPSDVFAAPAPAGLQTIQLSANNVGPFNAVYPIYVTLIITGANFNIVTAGSISIWLRHTPVA